MGAFRVLLVISWNKHDRKSKQAEEEYEVECKLQAEQSEFIWGRRALRKTSMKWPEPCMFVLRSQDNGGKGSCRVEPKVGA